MKRWMGRLFASLFSVAAATSAIACQITPVADIPVRWVDGRPVLTANLNDRPIDWVLATGSPTSTVARSDARRAGLTLYEVDHSNDFGHARNEREEWSYPSTLKLGSLAVREASFKVAVPSPGAPQGVGSTLGLAALNAYALELDLGHGRLRLLKANGCVGDEHLYWGGAYSMLALDTDHGWRLPASVNGKAVTVTVDSGAAESSITPDAALRLGLETKGRPRTALLDAVTLDQETLHSVSVMVNDSDASKGLVLGADFLRAHRVLVLPAEHRVYFTHNDGPGLVK